MSIENANQPAYLVQKNKAYADTCDRCGKHIGHIIENYPAYWMSTRGCNLTRHIGVGVIMSGKKRPLDLCDECAKELTEWMRH